MEESKRILEKGSPLKKDDLIVITGAVASSPAISRCISGKGASPTSARWTKSRFTSGIYTSPASRTSALT
jgi:hypothetical protein